MLSKKRIREMLSEEKALNTRTIERHPPNKLSKRYAKSTCSDSKKGTTDNFNGVAMDKNNMEIYCRHISFFVAQNHIKHSHHQLDGKEHITKVPMLYNNDVDRLKPNAHSSYYCYVEYLEDSLFPFLHRIAGLLPLNQQCTLMMVTENHEMAINVQYKEGIDNNVYVIKFYDPNETTKHKRMVFNNLDDVLSGETNSLLSDEDIVSYCPELNACLFISPFPVSEEQEPYVDLDSGTNLAAKLYFCLNFNLFGHIEGIINEINKLDIPEEHKFNLLLAKNEEASGLYMAMQDGHHQAVVKYVSAILTSKDLTPDHKYQLLVATSDDAMSGLYMAMQSGHYQLAMDYIASVLNAKDFSVNQKFELFAAKDSDGPFGLYMAMQGGHYQLVHDYVALVLASKDFSVNQKMELLATKYKYAGLYLAMAHGFSELVMDYVHAILTTEELNSNQKFELLAVVLGNDPSGLKVAMQKGHHQLVKNYMTAILTSTHTDLIQFLKRSCVGNNDLEQHYNEIKASLELDEKFRFKL